MAKQPKVRVTDHAVVRYLERVVGIDVEDIRRRIVEGRERVIVGMPKGDLVIPERRMKLSVVNGVVVTVVSTTGANT